MKTFTPSFIKKYRPTSLYEVFNWVTPEQSTTNCLQLLKILIMIQRSCFKQITVS